MISQALWTALEDMDMVFQHCKAAQGFQLGTIALAKPTVATLWGTEFRAQE